MTKEEFALKIDQTLLKPNATFNELESFITENKDVGFYSLCKGCRETCRGVR